MKLDVIRLERLIDTLELNKDDVRNEWLFEVEDLVQSLPSIKQKSISGAIFKLKTYSSSMVRDRSRVHNECISQIKGFLKSLLRDTANIESLERINRSIESAQESGIQQAVEHLTQAKQQLTAAADERARKNAVRDCASAMETVIKTLGCDDDIKQASKKLRESKQWGLDDIVKDGDAMFSNLHRLYPDFRHGSKETSNIGINEAKYWIERITVYIDFMLRQKAELGI